MWHGPASAVFANRRPPLHESRRPNAPRQNMQNGSNDIQRESTHSSFTSFSNFNSATFSSSIFELPNLAPRHMK